jgi:transposase
MKQWEEIRYRVLREGVSKREILRETGMHWQTLEKFLSHPEPLGYRLSQPRAKRKIGPYVERIKQIIKDDKKIPKKQRHTAKRIFERLQEEGYTGGYTQVKETVRQIKATSQEVFMPLTHRPGEAQADFGYALVNENGLLRKVVFFVMSLPYSGALFVQVFARICTEVFQEAHVRAFEFFDGVPYRITYDNETIFVSKILGAHERRVTDGFLKLKSHYLFDAHFCRVRCPNEKGVVENMVGFSRQNFLVPVPQVRNLEDLNDQLRKRCFDDLQRRLRGKNASKAALLEEERRHFLPLPPSPFDACAEIYHLNERIARHPRLWEKEGVQFDPLHYLALLERKPGSLDFARPLANWSLPDCFNVLRRRLEQEAEQPGLGTREYIRVLRLLENYSMPQLTSGIEKGLRAGALTRDAIAQFLIPQEDWRLTTFSLAGREHLRHVKVTPTRITAYGELLKTGGTP